jgi:hypothetical protein
MVLETLPGSRFADRIRQSRHLHPQHRSTSGPLLTLSRCHGSSGRRSADLLMVRLIIQNHIAAVHEFSIASDGLKGTSDSLEGTECH